MFLPKFSKFPSAASTGLLCLILVLLQLQCQFLCSLRNHSCLPQESAALLHFKSLFSIQKRTFDGYAHDINGNSNYYSFCDKSYPKTESWHQGTDCCNSWDGVTCDGADGHVTGIDLSCSWLRPAVPFTTNTTSSIMSGLPRLRSLNLALNGFNGSQMPWDIARLPPGLEYLNLSNTYFSGKLTHDFSSLPNLVALDLSVNPTLKFDVTSFETLVTNLTKLQVLMLGGSDLSSVSFASPINFTHSLRSLWIDDCDLRGHLHEETFKNLPNLERLSLTRNSGLEGSFPQLNWSSPIELLDLSYTNLSGLLPKSIRELNRLKTLDLTSCSFSGSFAPLDNLTELNMLGLGNNLFSGSIPVSLGKLTKLNWLDMESNNLSGSIPASLGNLTKLNMLELDSNSLSGSIPPSLGNLTELNVLILHHNRFSGSIPDSFSDFTQLTFLDLSYNELTGPIPAGIFSLSQLQHVYLGGNNLTGHLHEFHCKALRTLLLHKNKLQGSIPGSLLELVNLTRLTLTSNKFNGTVDLSKFSNFQGLYELDFSKNSLTVSTKQVKGNAPELKILNLGSCNLSEFPEFIRNNSCLYSLDLSDNKLEGEVPAWMFEVGKSTLAYLDMSHNFLTSFQQISWEQLQILDLRSNSITGNISTLPPQLRILLFANNKLTGGLPHSICSSPNLQILDLSNNSLSGPIPQCLSESKSLSILDLRINKFHGTIPDTFPLGCHLQTVNLRDNEFEGRVPQSLANCTELDVLDLGINKLNDTFPSSLAPLSELEVLILHSNQLYGPLVSSTTKVQFPKLRILDVSDNKFNGVISKNFVKHFKAMTTYGGINSSMRIQDEYYQDSVVLTLKGLEYEMERILTIFTTLDLSCNNFQGQIPRIVGNFQALKVLNLSHNNLTGQIPDSLGNLTEMETLDLSWNQLVGKIPQRLTSVTSLEVFNLSQNRLVGSIPQGMQFNTFSNDSYIGNFGLCGFPLSKECNSTSEVPTTPHEEDYSSINDFTWRPILVGFVGGFIVTIVATYVMFLIGKPQWFIGIVERESNRILKKRSRRHGRKRN